MTTSVLTQFDPIQTFGPLDPYSYLVDNRPLEDLKQNIDALAKAHDAALDAAKMAAVSTGMLARSLVGENVVVGKKSFGSLTLVIDHGVFVKEGDVYPSDPNSQFFPKLGLQQQGYTFNLSAPGTVGQIKYYTISGRYKNPDNTLSFFDNINPNTTNSVELGAVEYSTTSVTVAGAFDSDLFPAPTSGYVALFHVQVPYGTVSLTSALITNVYFVDDFYRAYSRYTDVTTTNGQTLFTGIGVNAFNALVFVAGVFQSSDNYTVDAVDQITWNAPGLDSGLTVDFVVLKGSGSGGGGGGTTTYAYLDDSYTVPGGPPQDTFAVNSPLDSDYVFVFVNGVFQKDIDRSTPGFVVLPAPVPAGTKIDFVQTVGGSALPPGGAAGQSVHNTGAGPSVSWQNEVLTVNVNSASGTAPLAYVSVAVGFNETFDLYEGRLLQLKNNGGFTSVQTNGGVTPTVTLQVSSLGALPVTRPGNIPLRNNDIYSGALVSYKTSPNRFELVTPGMPDIVSNFSSITGDQNNIVVTPNFPVLLVADGDTYSVKPVSALSNGNDQEVCSLTVTLADATPFTRPVGKQSGYAFVGLKQGDIQGGREHLFQYSSSLGYFLLLNPANSPVLEISGAKRQTVLKGPFTSVAKTYDKVDPVGLTRTTVSFEGVAPKSLQVIPSGLQRNLTTNTNVLVTFADGFDTVKGPVDYVQELPFSVTIQDVNDGLFDRGITPAGLQSIVKNATVGTLTLNYNYNHGVSVGTWVRVRGMVGDGTNPLIAANGTYYVEGVGSGSSLVLSCATDNSVTVTTGISSTVVDLVYFVYAKRDNDGNVTFGLNTRMPLYISKLADAYSTPISMAGHVYDGQHVFSVDEMRMYKVNSGGGFVQETALYLGEIYVPDSGTTFTEDFVNCYEYNGKYTAFLKSFGTPGDEFYSLNSSGFTHSTCNDIRHGMGTYLYDVRVNGLSASSSAGRAVGALQESVKFYPQQGLPNTNVYVLRKDTGQLCFTLPASLFSVMNVFGTKLQSAPTAFNYTVELERSF